MNNIFESEFEDEAIDRIRRFGKLARSMGFDICLGFSGGKDSQVVYDLCKRAGIKFKAYFNHSFESSTTLKFIKEFYPDVIFRRDHKFGFIENIWRNHGGLLPTIEVAYCCADYKHNPKYVDNCSITGVRRAESRERKARTTIEVKNKTLLKKSKALINMYFEEHCQSTGSSNVIQLKPIIDWSDEDVWNYIHKYNLTINPEYEHQKRVGCLVCPKANFNTNYRALLKYPKLIDAFIRARQKAQQVGNKIDWVITSDGKDYSNDKCYYICRWLNRSFRTFSESQYQKYLLVKKAYEATKDNV